MKIFIGKYINWWGPYQLFGLLNKVGVSQDTTDEWAERSPDWLTDLCQWIYNQRHRRVKIKIHNYDLWSMDSTLSMIILPMLKELKEVKCGSPGDLEEFSQTSNGSSQSCFDFYAEADELAWERGHQHWSGILDEIIWTFEQLQPDHDCEEQYFISRDSTNYNLNGLQLHQARIERGLALFGRYFRELWD